ncbi:MAG: glycosyltransferase family 39 protein [Alphaproteobacteria bacterium]
MAERNPTRTRSSQAADAGNAVLWAVAGLFAALTAAKFLIVGQLDLFYDEATYWQASLRPAAGYTHTLMMTPLLIRAGTFIFGDTLFGIRSLHLLCGAALPFAVYLLAEPMVGRRDAILAAGVTLIMPVTALLGHAYMDSPLFLFTVLGLAAFERARRRGGLVDWTALGAMCALGLATHYRFAPFGLGLLCYLLATRAGRRLWKKPGLWMAGAIAALGLAPVLWFNIETGFAGLHYQVVDRNPWVFQLKGLLFPFEQMLVVTPLLFAALIGVLWVAFRKARSGDDDCTLLAIWSAAYLGFYLVLGPFSDLKRVHGHWPAVGYVPLFVLLPGVLRGFAHGATGAAAMARRSFRWLVPASAAAATGAGIFFFAALTWPAALFPDSLQHLTGQDLVRWSLMKEPVSRTLAKEFTGTPKGVALVAGNYQVGAELDFMMRPPGGVFVLNHSVNVRNGIAPQLTLWNLDEGALRRTRAGDEAFIVIDDRDFWFESRREVAFRASVCASFSALRYLGDYEFPAGRKHLLFYKGRVNAPGFPPPPKLRPGNCATLPSAYMARPKRGDRVRGTVSVYGWVLDDDVGIERVEILVDGKAVALARYGRREHRIQNFMPASTDPNLPRVGYGYRWDSAMVGNGPHKIAIRATSTDGKIREFARRTVFVDNP